MDTGSSAALRAFRDGFRWDGVAVHPYKDDMAAPFRAVTRQVLFAAPELACELRYFEIAPGGFSSLERHEHAHAVMILSGEGDCLIGRSIRAVRPYDLITIPPRTWHQFRAPAHKPLGFLCMVNRERDRPQLPTEEDFAALKADPEIAAFLAGRIGAPK